MQNLSDSSPYSTGGSAQADNIRGVLIQVVGARLLLPNATIAEVLSYAPPDEVDDAPDWLLGRVRWRGWQLPLLAFARMAGIGVEQGELGSKMVVLKALGGDSKTPYFAMLTQGFPRLVTVSRDSLIVVDDEAPLPPGVQARVLLNEDPALVPDLAAIEALIGEASAQAA
ncbi:MAG: chemotaxis protein CheW [Pseudomonadota bacterium]|nr:chemotaxis protein CheW [Pseudomonadota bacterium]